MAERKVHFNKTLEEYVVRKWDEQIEQRVSAFRADYDERMKNAKDEVRALVEEANKKASAIMQKYDLDCTLNGQSRCNSLVSWGAYSVCNSKDITEILQYRRELQRKRDEALVDLKVECALGADRATFEAMIAKVTFD